MNYIVDENRLFIDYDIFFFLSIEIFENNCLF